MPDASTGSEVGNTWPHGNNSEQREQQMTIKDIGPEPQFFDLERETVDNINYRTVAWSGKYLQLTLMSIPEGGDIGLEMHPETDQFLRLDAGHGRVQMGPARDNLEFEQEVSDAIAAIDSFLIWRLTAGKVHATADDAAADTDDEPAIWSVQPTSATDLHA